jgi:hypothetical protein
MSDNEDTPPALGDGTSVVFHSDILSVQRAVGPPIPEFFQPSEEGSKCPSSVRCKQTGDVFVDEPTRPQDTSQLKEGKSEVSSGTFNACAEARDREVLAVVDDDAFCRVGVIICDLNVVDRLDVSGVLDLADKPPPLVSHLKGTARNIAAAHLIVGPLVDLAALDDALLPLRVRDVLRDGTPKRPEEAFCPEREVAACGCHLPSCRGLGASAIRENVAVEERLSKLVRQTENPCGEGLVGSALAEVRVQPAC